MLGIIIGCGLLSKANYGFVPLGCLLLLGLRKETRHLIFYPKDYPLFIGERYNCVATFKLGFAKPGASGAICS